MSCSNDPENPTITTISFQNPPSTSIGELIDSYEVILLSEEEAFLLKKTQKIQIADEKIFILDRNNMSGRILIFDRQGKGLRAIDKPGKGPGEYVQIVDFDISPEERSIVIADAGNKKVLHYNFDGQHLHSSKVDHWIKNINVLEDGNGKAKLIVTSPIGSQSTSTGDNYDLFIHDREMNVENKYLPFSKPNEAGMGNGFNMYETSDGLSFYRSFTNHVYRVNRRGDYSQKYVVQFPAPILPSSRVMDHMIGAVPMNDFVYFVSFFENQDHLIFTYSWDNKNYLGAYNKKNDKTATAQIPEISGCKQCFNLNMAGTTDNALISYFNSENIEDILNAIDPDKNKCVNEEVLKQLTSDNTNGGNGLLFINLK